MYLGYILFFSKFFAPPLLIKSLQRLKLCMNCNITILGLCLVIFTLNQSESFVCNFSRSTRSKGRIIVALCRHCIVYRIHIDQLDPEFVGRSSIQRCILLDTARSVIWKEALPLMYSDNLQQYNVIPRTTETNNNMKVSQYFLEHCKLTGRHLIASYDARPSIFQQTKFFRFIRNIILITFIDLKLYEYEASTYSIIHHEQTNMRFDRRINLLNIHIMKINQDINYLHIFLNRMSFVIFAFLYIFLPAHITIHSRNKIIENNAYQCNYVKLQLNFCNIICMVIILYYLMY